MRVPCVSFPSPSLFHPKPGPQSVRTQRDHLQGLTGSSLGTPGSRCSLHLRASSGLDVCKCWGQGAGEQWGILNPPGRGRGEPWSTPLPPAEASDGRRSSCTRPASLQSMQPRGSPGSNRDAWEVQPGALGLQGDPQWFLLFGENEQTLEGAGSLRRSDAAVQASASKSK